MTRLETPRLFLLLCTVFTWFCVAEQRASVPSIETDGKALIILKQMIKDPDGVLGGWRLINNTCSWYGVTCSHGRVSQLDLSYQDFQGTISFEHFAAVDKLMVLKMSAMGLAFSINSTSLLLLPSSLKELDLSLTTLVGPLPRNLFSKCHNLEILNLSFSNLTGSLPDSFFMNASKLQVLKMSHNNLSGSISNLRIESPCNFLRQFDLAWNHISDSLPAALSKCTNLKDLNLGNNKFSGEIPTTFGQFINIQKIDISYNHLTGRIPFELGNVCSSLQELFLSHNNILGPIPLIFRSCIFLKVFDLSNNNISKPFPSSLLWNLSSLEKLLLSKNMISGAFPSSIKYCQNLRVVDFSSNNLSGVIPTDICPGAISLEELMIPDNYITGELPPQISHCSQLTKIDFSLNNMSGLIPTEFGMLKNLKQLIGWLSGLEGSIPSELGKCRKLNRLVLNNNRLNGKIPIGLRNCSNLEWISLSHNRLSGEIPWEFGQLTKLSILQLGHNNLSGELPQQLAQCSSLLWLDLSNNKLTGEIPSPLGRQMSAKASPILLPTNTYAFIRDGGTACNVGGLLDVAGIRPQRLRQVLKLKDCHTSKRYSGVSLSIFIGYETIQYLDLSHNQLVGRIPDEFGDAEGLQVLDLSYNQLSSEIPASLGKLKNLIVFEAAHNTLHGEIPYSLSNLSFLWRIDLSYNQLTGEIPQRGQLVTFPASQYAHNFGLCGVPLRKCKDNSQVANAREKTSTALGIKKIIIGTLISFVFACILIVCTVAICLKWKKEERVKMLSSLQSSQVATAWNFNKEKEPLSINVAIFEKQLKTLKISQLIEATNNFSTTNLIGRGGYGEVFKATLNDGSKVAIKKLMGFNNEGDRDFKAEMETLGKIKHRNLVALLGYCKVGEKRLLVYEFMEHGSLEHMLHRKAEAQNIRF